MIEFTVPASHNRKRVDTFLFDMLGDIPSSIIFKAFRKRDVRVNTKRVNASYLLSTGDNVQIYIPREYLNKTQSCLPPDEPDILYEDDYVLVVSKPQGMPVQRDKNRESRVLDAWVRDFLGNRDQMVFQEGFPALCHRLDRNTGGLVLFAKDPSTLGILTDKFRFHEIRKIYHCLVNGIPAKNSTALHGFLRKDSRRSLVFIFDKPVKGSEPIITRYRVLKKTESISLLEVELVTGKTHQIRAHLAYVGHPVLGDGKYGINSVNRKYRLKRQALWAKEITFQFTSPSGHLEYLNGRTISLSKIGWEGELNHILN